MTRICDDFAYGNGPVESCFWNQTASTISYPALFGEKSVEVAIVGAGYTGLSAALHLANAGMDVALLDEQQPGWGASGRNGGFCCLGGSHIKPTSLAKRVGETEAREYFLAERDAVTLVADLLSQHGIDADTHSEGETMLAHRKRDMLLLERKAREVTDLYDVNASLLTPSDLARQGMTGPFHGGLTIPIGFALNPRKYALGLARAAETAGVAIYGSNPVTEIDGELGRFILKTSNGIVRAKQIIIATNGYSREDVPRWLAGRYMPAQSSVIVTRPLTKSELEAQGWISQQMAYDTRALLHYFRLMPDGRFLFGMRGGLRTGAKADQGVRHLIRRDFERMFPAWSSVETPFYWSGFVCFSRNLTPFAGPVPGHEGVFSAFAYHGNGVAMASYCGALVAEQILGRKSLRHPTAILTQPTRFPGGRLRRLALWPAYLGYGLSDI